MKLFSYVVDHDYGDAPNPYFGYCTLRKCKYKKKVKNLIESVAEYYDFNNKKWKEDIYVVGTGGVDGLRRGVSSGKGTIIYAMKVDEVLTAEEYRKDKRFQLKKPNSNGNYKQKRGDNDNVKCGMFVLISKKDNFYYFGKRAIKIKNFPNNKKDLLEKNPRGYHYKCYDNEYIEDFWDWIKSEAKKTGKTGKIGKPCGKEKIELEEGTSKCNKGKNRKRKKTC